MTIPRAGARWLAGVGLAAVALRPLDAQPPAPTPVYDIYELAPIPGGTISEATAINEIGDVVGNSDAPGTTGRHAVLWRTKGCSIQYTATDLGVLGKRASSGATGINDRGQIVGYSEDQPGMSSPGGPRAFRTHPYQPIDTATDDLETLGGHTSFATGIDDDGRVVGSSALSSGLVHAFRTGPGARILPDRNDLRSFSTGPTESVANAINRFGVVVGQAMYYSNAGGAVAVAHHAFRLASGFLGCPAGPCRDQDLDTRGAGGSTGSEARAINARGEAVGSLDAFSAGNPTHAFYYDTHGTLTDLDTLSGDSFSLAYGINDASVIVGTSISSSGVSRAFVFSAATKMLDLNTLIPPSGAWTLESAAAINNAGEIVGLGTLNGEPRGFLLVPRLYDVTDLGTLGGLGSIAAAINDGGEIAGSAQDRTGVYQAFRWVPVAPNATSGEMEQLSWNIPALNGTVTIATENTRGTAINDAGGVAGTADLRSGIAGSTPTRAVRWDIGHGDAAADAVDGWNSVATGINNADVVVGQFVGSGPRLGFATSGTLAESTVGNDGFRTASSTVNAINDVDMVVGGVIETTGGAARAFVHRGGPPLAPSDIIGAPGTYSEAFAISKTNVVVGDASVNGARQPFIWDQAGGMRTLDKTATMLTHAAGVNSCGSAVGSDHGSSTGILWRESLGRTNLSTVVSSGWQIEEANGINDLGQIVGVGRKPASYAHAVLLTPHVTSEGLPFPHPLPVITAVTPKALTVNPAAAANRPPITVTIQGGGFIPESVVVVRLEPLTGSPTTSTLLESAFVSSHFLTVQMPAAYTVEPAVVGITVENPPAGGRQSNEMLLSIGLPLLVYPPTVTATGQIQAGGTTRVTVPLTLQNAGDLTAENARLDDTAPGKHDAATLLRVAAGNSGYTSPAMPEQIGSLLPAQRGAASVTFDLPSGSWPPAAGLPSAPVVRIETAYDDGTPAQPHSFHQTDAVVVNFPVVDVEPALATRSGDDVTLYVHVVNVGTALATDVTIDSATCTGDRGTVVTLGATPLGSIKPDDYVSFVPTFTDTQTNPSGTPVAPSTRWTIVLHGHHKDDAFVGTVNLLVR